MELYDRDFLEELMSLRREENHYLFSNNNAFSSNFDSFDQNSHSFVSNSNNCAFQEYPQSYYNNEEYAFNEIYTSMLEEFSAPQLIHSSPSQGQEDFHPLMSMLEDKDPGFLGEDFRGLELQNVCKMEPGQSPEMPVLDTPAGSCVERKSDRAKKIQGQPSKNLMAERRRRKRLNDRLSMLRSIVPKISKMDRTSILGDTISYMKELLEKINDLKQEIEVVDSNGIFRDIKPNEIFVRNSPKFDVERRNVKDTRVEICCGAKPGLLLSTVNTLEALGLEIQHCVISCFNDFTMQASCTEELEHNTILSSEDIKQALFRSAGFGGRCLC